MSQLLSSDVDIQEEAPSVVQIPTVATAVLGMAGVSERGPVDKEVACTAPEEWQRIFGNDVAYSDSSLSVKMFFQQGGTTLHFARIVHHADATDPTTKTSAIATVNIPTASAAPSSGSVTSTNAAPWALHAGETLVVTADGGSPHTATFNATAGALESGNSAAYNLTDGWTITLTIDGGSVQTVVFHTANFVSIAAATAAEVAAVFNAYFAANGIGAVATVTSSTKVTITSTRKGSGSDVHVTGGTANAAIGFSTTHVAGTGNVSNISAVTFAEAKSIIEAAATGETCTSVSGFLKITSNTTGGASSILVGGSSTAGAEFGFDNATHTGSAGTPVSTIQCAAASDGTWGNGIKPIVADATSGESDRFNLQAQYNGVVQETWPNLSTDPTDPRYFVTIVNDANVGSAYLHLTDLEVLTVPANRPANGTYGPLTGGADGLSSLADSDFNGGTGVNGSVGLRCFDEVDDLTLLVVPGRATASVHNGMITYCEIVREGLCFAIFDPPLNQTAEQIVDYVKNTASILRLSELCAIYWPNILIDNPNKSVYGNTNTIVVPPSGAIAGVYSRTDAKTPFGVFTPPAGTENGVLLNVRGVEMTEVKKKPKRNIVFPQLINPIRPGTGGVYLDGARCLKDNGNWPTIGERRGIIFVETSLRLGLDFLRQKNITDRLYTEGKNTTKEFMLDITRSGALASTDPSQAFVADWGKGLNTASAKFARHVFGRVAVATAKPAEFVTLRVAPDNRALEAELAAA